MRSHPVVGAFFILAGLGLLSLGALARDAPAFLDRLPLPPQVVVPFVLLLLATWSLLFGVYFLRPRGRHARSLRAVPRI